MLYVNNPRDTAPKRLGRGDFEALIGDPWGTIRSWRRRGCIVQNDDGSYTKTVA